ncbi:MAG: tetratricopeptide repeat protein [Hyphomicrobium sp.]|uniref:O-linked N-acetylglucosamine transferase family protein n=1 Tax=Hyphomicrobium sp. TaxID=82 RepID=UPI0039E275A1
MNRRERRRAEATSRHVPQQIQNAETARHFQEAVQHLKSGRFNELEVAHRRVLSVIPKHAPSLHHLGLIAINRQDPVTAVELIRQSVDIQPDYHEAWLNLAIILGDLRYSKEAIEACEKCVALRPEKAEHHAVLGNLLRVAKKNAEAMTAYLTSLEIRPDNAVVLARLGQLHLASGEFEAATACCKRALELDPKLEEARQLERRLSLASRSLDMLIADIEANSKTGVQRAKKFDDLATYLRDERRFSEAADLCRRAIEADPGGAEYFFNYALNLEALGEFDQALENYQMGFEIEPGFADAYAGLGNLLRNMNMFNGAIQAYEQAIKLKPNLATAYYNLAITYKLRDQYEEAREAFQRCIECAPDAIVSRFEFVNLRRVLCDWDGVDAEERSCLEIFRQREVTVAPFQLISLWASAADLLRAAESFIKTFDVPESQRFSTYKNRLGVGAKIRIGFVSCDFFEHATAMLFAEVLEKIDRSRFEVFAYCHSPDDNSAMRKRLLATFDHFRKIGALRYRDVAATIHDDAIDILVDLKGFTRDARTEIFAYRAAPIQVNYLGYPGTMGADFIDYLIADAVVAPMEAQHNYSERIVHLPNSYQPNDRQRDISQEPVTRADHGLPDDAFVFCSFNNSYKLNSTMFDIWMPLLKKVPGSVLWLLVPNETCADNLRKEAANRGVDPARLVFAKRASIEKHLARHRLADLFLDALPCNAHTTTSDALWAGLPVLTCLGETFAGRVAASLLTAMGVPELVTTNLDDYAKLALDLAQDKAKLEALRNKIIGQRDKAPLFDSTRYTRNLERSFETMVEIKRAGEAPRAFVVVENEAPARAPAAKLDPATELRALFEACPLCDGREMKVENEARITNHRLYNTIMPPVLKWCRCASCDHVFTEGYLTPAGAAIVQSAAPPEASVGKDAENARKASAKIVARAARYIPDGDWLDIGFGNASRVFTAAEWGYRVTGIDADEAAVAKLKRFGCEAYQSLDELTADGRFSVVSMIDVLDRVPFPNQMLAAINKMMRPGGALILSLPNRDTIVWRALDATRTNPYWGELERYHSFTRAGLIAPLKTCGFEFAEYGIRDDHRSAMEIVAIKAPEV